MMLGGIFAINRIVFNWAVSFSSTHLLFMSIPDSHGCHSGFYDTNLLKNVRAIKDTKIVS
jgi:hypothetical protein